MVNVMIVDDDRLVGMSLKTIIEASGEIKISAVGLSGFEAISLYNTVLPDILLMDIRMDKMTGLEAGERILSAHPDAKILYLTTFADDEYIVRALRLGAKGYILKQDYENIVPALKAVYAGQSVFGKDIMAKIPGLLGTDIKSDTSVFGLTPKELEIMNLIADGMTNKDIAASLYLSEGTVRNYVSLLIDKLGLRSRTQIAIFYYKNIGR